MLSCWRCLSVGTICFGSHRNANRRTLFTKYFCQNTLHHGSNTLFPQLHTLEARNPQRRGSWVSTRSKKYWHLLLCETTLWEMLSPNRELAWVREGLKGFPRGSKVSQEVSTIQSVPRRVHHHTECPQKFTISFSCFTTLPQYIWQINRIDHGLAHGHPEGSEAWLMWFSFCEDPLVKCHSTFIYCLKILLN